MIEQYVSPLGVIPMDKRIYNDMDEAHHWLEEYFGGKCPQWRPEMHLQGTDFQLRVWHLLREIPYGETVSYGELAHRISSRMSPQAVGQAVHQNPCPVIIPCHRVVGAGGRLTGYALGLEFKSALLAFERNTCSGRKG